MVFLRESKGNCPGKYIAYALVGGTSSEYPKNISEVMHFLYRCTKKYPGKTFRLDAEVCCEDRNKIKEYIKENMFPFECRMLCGEEY